MKTKKPIIPTWINDVKVFVVKDSKKKYKNEWWVTLLPEDENDPRIWEFSITSHKIIQTKFE